MLLSEDIDFAKLTFSERFDLLGGVCFDVVLYDGQKITESTMDYGDSHNGITNLEIIRDCHSILNDGFSDSKSSGSVLMNGVIDVSRRKKVVFTGKLSKNRSAMQQEAREQGLIVLSYPNPKVDILVCGELASPT